MKNKIKKYLPIIIVGLLIIGIIIFIFNSIYHSKQKEIGNNKNYLNYSSFHFDLDSINLEDNPMLWDYTHSSLGWHSVDKINDYTEKYEGYAVLLKSNKSEDTFLIDKYMIADVNNVPLAGEGVKEIKLNESDSQYLNNWMNKTTPDEEEKYDGEHFYLYILPIGTGDGFYDNSNQTMNGVVDLQYVNDSYDDSYMERYVEHYGYPTDWLNKRDFWDNDFLTNPDKDGNDIPSLFNSNYHLQYMEKIIIPTKAYASRIGDHYEKVNLDDCDQTNYIIYTVTSVGIRTNDSTLTDINDIDFVYDENYLTFEEALDFTSKVYLEKFKIRK